MKEKISRTSLVIAVIVVLYFALLGSGSPGSMVIGYTIGAVLAVPSIILGPWELRVSGILGLGIAVFLAFHDHDSEQRVRSMIRQQIQEKQNKDMKDDQANHVQQGIR